MRKNKEIIESVMNGNIAMSKAFEVIKFPARPESSNNTEVDAETLRR